MGDSPEALNLYRAKLDDMMHIGNADSAKNARLIKRIESFNTLKHNP